jgi:single-strand DNA-binding protein
LEKGRLVAVTGRIQTRSYEGNDGTRRYVTEIVADEVNFLERSKQERQAQQPATPQEQGGFTPVDPGEDDELPF